VHGVRVLLDDFLGCVLERLKAGNEDIGQAKKALGTRMVFVIAAEDLLG